MSEELEEQLKVFQVKEEFLNEIVFDLKTKEMVAYNRRTKEMRKFHTESVSRFRVFCAEYDILADHDEFQVITGDKDDF